MKEPIPVRTKVYPNRRSDSNDRLTSQRPAVGKVVTTLVVVAIIVIGAISLVTVANYLSIASTNPGAQSVAEPSTSSTVTSTSTCSSVATQDNPLVGFRVEVNYNRSWSATATGYSNSTANQVFTNCYAGSGTGWILINNWNPNAGSILNVTVSKLDGSNGNLTATLGGERASTIAPNGSVKVSETEVP